MYKAIFFDIDDTLLNFSVANRAAFIQSFAEFNLDHDDATYSTYKAINHHLWEKQKLGQITVQDVINNRFKQLFRALNLELNHDHFRDTFQGNLAKQHTLEAGAVEAIDYLSQKYKLFAASNSILIQQKARLDLAGLLPHFSDLYISDDIGYEKPDQRFFETCLHRSQIAKEEVLFIGDSLEADMKGAASCQISTCWYNPNNLPNQLQLNITHTIQHLSDLVKIL
ncbi:MULTISPECIES: YjjG family noncanonical pyrimidine nucleotidase [Acinetobacter]|uniref:YjjG family noncanonical pyrimidine nucleotidase n=1 Tax=Acinetobacter TaxID=469 RepID=UPI00051ADA60|nr:MULTISPECIES: YjjG family noncanonical pyrimidine nucleotidase [Acinetobacter]MCH7378510.1 YjjG family noncanonical pyrimidine nucleotidase [Acinetobacter higginsii]MCI3879373.1 YjjG family noncanonical pyrimidine nucleotidase [Acinetobacter higginsii]NNP75664.1 noncanonical pyrimidine nucleotidase, YjjG family [Acinetobacter sp. Ac_3412]